MNVNIGPTVGIPLTSHNDFNEAAMNPFVILFFLIIIVLYYTFFSSLGQPAEQPISMPHTTSQGFEILLWSLFIILILFNGLQYFFNINVVASLKKFFTAQPELDLRVEMPKSVKREEKEKERKADKKEIKESSTIEEITATPQVFHIPGNEYTYEDADALCQAYGGRLASYPEVSKAHETGADWCSYGWSDNQMALFPTQMEKWEKLQTIPGHEHDCGRPGINGGYIANPNVRFGVNCYGYKPKITNLEAQIMSEQPLYPESEEELEFQKRVDYWKNNISNILVAPFNHETWSTV